MANKDTRREIPAQDPFWEPYYERFLRDTNDPADAERRAAQAAARAAREARRALAEESRKARIIAEKAERVAELRHAMAMMFADPEFLADAQSIQLELDTLNGEALQDIIRRSFDYPKALVEKAEALARPE